MQVYQTNKEGYFVGVTSADRDPLNKDNWLIPGGCVTTEPPLVSENQLLKWKFGEWAIEDVVQPEPEPELPVDYATQVRMERNSLLQQSDWTQVADAPVDQTAWATYRQALRDVTTQEGFPEAVVWPVAPN
jgi:hypothetical protein